MKDPADQFTPELMPLPSRTETYKVFSDFTRAMVANVVVKVSGRTVYDGPPVWGKRGRGRPRLANPLTAAERARRYRQRKAAAKKKSTYDISQKVLDTWKKTGMKGFYRGPHGETWTGRGLTPKWLQVLIQQGRDKQSFFVTL